MQTTSPQCLAQLAAMNRMGELGMSWIGKLHELQAAATRAADPWHLRLERVRGQLGEDGVERISTQTVFDFLEVVQRRRGTAACRRLAQVMRELGWRPVRVRDLTRGGYKEQVRGYCREARNHQC